MRSVLAVSGMHIAQYRPEQKHLYIAHAAAHHKAASRTAIALMTELLPQHQEDLWIFSVLTIYFGKTRPILCLWPTGSHGHTAQPSAHSPPARLALGTPRDPSASLLIGERVLPDWIFLLNGVHHLLSALQSTSYSGILSPVLKNGADRWRASHRSEHQDANLLHDLTANVRSTVTDPEELKIYDKAIRELRCQISLVFSSERQDLDIMDAMVWHFVMADSFMPLLKQMKQEAVAIFAHSLVIFNAFEGHKWLHGWDAFLMSRIWDILDEEHRLWIQWPVEEIGWVPPSGPLVVSR